MSTHEVGISDYFLGEKWPNGEFYFKMAKAGVFFGFFKSPNFDIKTRKI
jgi:hypothetical protein